MLHLVVSKTSTPPELFDIHRTLKRHPLHFYVAHSIQAIQVTYQQKQKGQQKDKQQKDKQQKEEEEEDAEDHTTQQGVLDEDNVLMTFPSLANIMSFEEFLNKHPNNVTLHVVDTYIHLLQSMQLLDQHHICHNALDLASLFVQPTTLHVKIKDIYRAFYYDRPASIKHALQHYQPHIIERPFEMHLLSYILQHEIFSLSRYNIECVLFDVYRRGNRDGSDSKSGDDCDSDSQDNKSTNEENQQVTVAEQEIIDYYAKYINKSWKTIFHAFTQHANTWNNHALSHVFELVLQQLVSPQNQDHPFVLQFHHLLQSNMSCIPTERATASDTLHAFHQLRLNFMDERLKRRL